MIIECPACATRYNIQATLPPEGRPVRCAKCGNVWRAQPLVEGDEPEIEAAGEPAGNNAAHEHFGDRGGAGYRTEAAGHTEPGHANGAAHEEHGYHGEDGDGEAAHGGAPAGEAHASGETADQEDEHEPSGAEYAVQQGSGDDEQAAAVSPAQDDAGEPAQAEPSAPRSVAQAASAGTGSESAGQADTEADGKVRWFGMLRRGDRPARSRDDVASEDRDSDGDRGKTIPFPAPHAGHQAAQSAPSDEEEEGSSYDALEDARAAVRGVFAGLSETRPADQAPTRSPILASAAPTPTRFGVVEDTEDAAGQADAKQQDAQMEGGVPSGAGMDQRGFESGIESDASAVEDESEFEDRSIDTSHFRGYGREHTADARTEDDSPEDDQSAPSDSVYLRGHGPHRFEVESGIEDRDHRATHRQAGAPGYGEEREDWPASQDALDDRIARELEDTLRHAPRPGRSVFDETAAGYEQEHEDDAKRLASSLWMRPKPADEGGADDGPDSDAGTGDPDLEDRLAREIEDRRLGRHATIEEEDASEEKRGGLVVAAAWGMFLCLAAGIVVAFFAFRDIIAGALPGTAPVYRALGTPVTVQPLVFEDVEYNWAIAENGKPMLVVKGSIYNRARRRVAVPMLYVGVKDKDPAFDREFRTLLQTGRRTIRHSRSANFSLELVGPRRSLSAIELEIRNVR